MYVFYVEDCAPRAKKSKFRERRDRERLAKKVRRILKVC